MITNLGDEALVESSEALLAGDGEDRGPAPVVLWGLAGNLDRVLDSALDNVHGGVENGTDGATNGTGNEVVAHLTLLGFGLGEELSDLEDTAKVTGVPENVSPQRTLKTLVEGERTLVSDRLGDDVKHAVVLAGRSLVLETDLDKLKGDDDKGLGSTSRGTSEDGERLVHLFDAEEVAVDLPPFVVGSELGRTLGSLHQDGRGDSTVETRETGAKSAMDSPKR